MREPIIRKQRQSSEYTVPLSGRPEHVNAGVIKVIGKYGEKYSVGKIEYQLFPGGDYQYIIEPYWDVIDGLDPGIFFGIPGIEMELRRDKYYRVNRHPVFVTERSPSENREDLQELMESVQMEQYDRFEWLIRTDLISANDNLVVERFREGVLEREFDAGKEFVEQLQYGDRVMVRNQDVISGNPAVYTEKLLGILGAGAIVVFEQEGIVLDADKRSSVLSILRHQHYLFKEMQYTRHKEGVEAAKRKGAYRGRRPIKIDDLKLRKVSEQFHSKKITEAQAMERLGLVSRSTFYRKLKSLKP